MDLAANLAIAVNPDLKMNIPKTTIHDLEMLKERLSPNSGVLLTSRRKARGHDSRAPVH